jgi:integrase
MGMEDGMAKDDQLSARKVATLKEPGYHLDGRGLYLQVTTRKDGTPAKSWVLRYNFGGRVREMGLGDVKTRPLAEARKKSAECRCQVKDGVDPIKAREGKRAEAVAKITKRLTFEQASEQYLKAHSDSWVNAKHRAQWPSTLKSYAFPVMGDLPVDEIDLSQVLKVLEPIWKEKPETASRLRGRIERVLSWATVRGYRSGDNPARWRGYLSEVLAAKPRSKQHPSLPYEEIPEFMPWLRNRDGIAARALEFLILTGVRVTNGRKAAWTEIDLNKRVWEVPGIAKERDGQRMKMGRPHRVPLCDRAMEILKSLPRINEHVFPGARGLLSENTLNKRAKSSGFVDPKQDNRLITAHGFRSTLKTWGKEKTDIHQDVLDRATAHQPRDKIAVAYERGDLFEKRRRFMNEWSRYCSSPPVKDTPKVYRLHGAA